MQRTDKQRPDSRPQKDAKPRGEKSDRKDRCANCGREGHEKDSCRKPKVELSKRPCFVCGEPGHVARLCPKKPADANELDNDDEEDEEIAAMIYDDTDLDSEDEFVGMADVEDERREWKEPMRHMRTRRAYLCKTRSECSCGCPATVPAATFEVLASSSASGGESDASRPPLANSSSEGEAKHGTVDFNGVDSESESDDDGESCCSHEECLRTSIGRQCRACCPYMCV